MTREQRQRFLVTAAQVAPQYYPLFFTLTSMGMRVGEGLAWPRGRLGTPKAGHGRTVDVSQTRK